MKRIGSRAFHAEERRYSSSDYESFRQTILEVKNTNGYRITGEYLCAYGETREWLCFYDRFGHEEESHRYSFAANWIIEALSLGDLTYGGMYGAAVVSGSDSLAGEREFKVVFFNDGCCIGAWNSGEAVFRDLSDVELNNVDVASYPGWALLEWNEEDLFDTEICGADFIFRTVKDGKLKHLPRLLPIGQMVRKPDTDGLLELIRKSAEPGVCLAGVILLSDPEALRSLCDQAFDPAVREKAAERLGLYETLGYFPPDACEFELLSEKEAYCDPGRLVCGEYSPKQTAIFALSHISSYIRDAAAEALDDQTLTVYLSRHDADALTGKKAFSKE